MQSNSYLNISAEVGEALRHGQPVVALESTIIAHGMPYPQNLETALMVEEEVRRHGAVPATIAVMEGSLQVGCSTEQLKKLASSAEVMKVSRRDLPTAILSHKPGATTVAATMIAAEMAGIRVFVTGGIGGVHRMADKSFDVSADLPELANTGVAVVCAGAKAILDIPKTLEVLETSGVPVITFRSDEFPAFYSRASGIMAELRMDSEADIAAFLKLKWSMGLKGGVLIANPVPVESDFPGQEMESFIQITLKEAAEKGISGKAVTPFLLARIRELTGGRSLASNISLVMNNARLGAEIASQLLR